MKRQLIIWLVCLQAVVAWGGHIIIDGTYTSPEGGIYSGTTRTYQVYVPDEYDGTTPACLYVGLDGVLCDAPRVMDSLIAARAMPVTIGIFLQPGVIRDAKGEVIRYNRSNEFDMPDGTFARFLDEQLLPHALSLVTPDGRRLHISPRGDDHMIMGLSSGGIAAFSAAWHRPDLFRRVFSGVGTFVAMRGGNDLQAIVRKHEPQPLRIYLQDGTADVWNPIFGHWYEGNRMLASALEFAGYDCACDWSDGGHNVRRATQIFAQVMQWMWRDWPAPIACGTTLNDFLAPLLIAGESWQQHPAAPIVPHLNLTYNADSTLCVGVGRESNCLWQAVIDRDKLRAGQPFYWLHSYDNRQLRIGDKAFDGDGNLWVLTNAGLQVCDQNGRVRAMLILPELGESANIEIEDGMVRVSDGRATYTRRLHVKAPVPGVRPKSQGQG